MANWYETQIYITGCLYQSSAYPDDPITLQALIADALNDISGLIFGSLSLNRTEARFSGGTTREQLLVFLKAVNYDNQVYLSDSVSSTLRTNIINKLNTITDFTYTDVEIRTMGGIDT